LPSQEASVRLNRGSLRFKFGAACGVVLLGLATACGGGAAAPTPTPVPSAGVSAVPAASPQRPPLASPAASPSTASNASGATPAPTTSEAAGGGETYEVQPGDTLAIISNQFYGDPTQWRRIYDANKDTIGADPDKLKIGMKLTIPPKQ
jgi:nucleoid-associated protein YgaU